MHVFLITPFEPIPGVDGDVRPLRQGMLFNKLIISGHRVTWINSAFDHFTKKFRENTGIYAQWMQDSSVKLLEGCGYKRNKSIMRIIHNQQTARNLDKFFRSNTVEPDVLFISLPTIELAYKSVQYAVRNKISSIVDINDIWPEVYLSGLPTIAKPLGRLILFNEYRKVKFILSKATSIVAVSSAYMSWAYELVKREDLTQKFVFPLGTASKLEQENDVRSSKLETFIKKHNIPKNKYLITFVGQLSNFYDIETIIEAARLLQNASNIVFAIAGDGIKKERAEKSSRNLNNVLLTGWLSREESEYLLRISSVGLCSYIANAPQSMPNKVYEYLAAGLPLLSTLGGEVENLIKEHGIGMSYVPGEAQSLAFACLNICKSSQQLKEMSNRAYNIYISRFSADRIYAKLEQHVLDMCQINKAPLG